MSFDPKSTAEMRKLAEGFYGPHQIDDHIEAINAYEEACDPRQIIHFADLIDSQAKEIAELSGAAEEARRVLAMMVDPDTIQNTTLGTAYAACVAAETRLRALLQSSNGRGS